MKILTKHPEKGKTGRNIDKETYGMFRRAFIQGFGNKKEMPFMELLNSVEKRLKGKFYGSIPWYFETLKLDLEARKIIERVPNSNPQVLKLRRK